MKNYPLILIALLFGTLTTFAQTSQGEITGQLFDEKGAPFPFVNMLLLHGSDSTLIKGVITDEKGQYRFESIKNGEYIAQASMVGYQKEFTNKFKVESASVKLPDINMHPESQALGEVTVVAKKPFIEQQIDRTVLNVENSIVSAGATALEVLERAPGVTVDQQNEQLKLRGKGGVIVQIDGKQTFLSQQELIALLRNTPSDNIEKIELITNPSSKYDAAGNSGIINIKMKRNKNFGTNGNISLGLTHSRFPRTNVTAALNHRVGKISSFISLGTFYNKGFNNNDIYRKIPYEDKVTIFDQRTERVMESKYHNIRAGFDYYATEKTTIGVLVSGFLNDWGTVSGQTNTKILNQDLQLDRTFNTQIDNAGKLNNVTANLNLKHQFDSNGKELTMDADYVKYGGKKYSNLNTRYFSVGGEQIGASEEVRNNMPSDIQIGTFKLDYTQPLGKGKFETGLKTSYVTSDNDMIFEIKNDTWEIDPSRSNQFIYTENINAAYLNYSGSLTKRIKYQLGLRGEHTHSLGNSVTLNSKTDRNYLNIFPSVFISNQLDTNNVINLSYSRRIDRPNYQSLNPFEFYLDPYTFSKGNPNLRPQYTNSFQLIHVFKNAVNTTLAYSRIKDVISNELPQQIASENKTFVTSQNLDTQDNFSVTVSMPIPVKKWWNIQTNLTGTYDHYDSYYLQEKLEIKQYSWNIYANNQFTLPNDWSFELSGWYNSKSFYGLYRAMPMGMINAGVQKKVFNKKGSVRFNVNDIFWTNQFRGHAQYKDIDFTVKSQWPSRQFRVTFTYNFGNQNVKGARQRQTGSDDMQKRAGGGN
ncbi:outer membrane beta-barrel family protein [Dyadobacter tibetensis]|uniref:outer membrane beta-barrel family protein n=1 Tax=Dyadobacter tibetensis TaxID=1211851 RepID=UPI00046F9873|nr:outer membrane beta-barrel family protein [Dyadobacter tibetensis]